MTKRLKKIIIAITALIGVTCFLFACGGNKAIKDGTEYTVTVEKHTGAIGDVLLISPTEGEEIYVLPTFVWSAADNADTYEFEICSSEDFSQYDDRVYVKKTGITEPQYKLFSAIKEKNSDYFWRVTAVNGDTRKRSETGSFYLAADEREILFDVNYADEWKVHEQGSDATISVDDGDFFGNGKNSLVISFVEEDTKQGIPSSDGWIVVTHSQETEMYGVDAFYFNFYYSGDDAEAYLRVVDEDNEYWHAQIKLATNAKQTVIIKFADFELRTKGGTTIANQVFDYNYIKYVELVFEKSFGDGVAMISDLRAIKYDNYRYLFMDKFDFNEISGAVIHDNYNFGTEISEEGSAFTYSFSGTANENNGSGINGYGFVKFPVEKLLVNGDAFRLKLDYQGNISSGNVLIRIIEEDGDRWVYRQKLSVLGDEPIIVPYMAFTLSEYKGDGSRQFYYVKQLQLGVEKIYSTGSVTVSDFEITDLTDEIEDLYKSTVDENGVIDDFNGYTSDVEMYYRWMLSESNKDEAIAIETSFALGTGNTCARLGYKADMGQAMYATMFDSPDKNYSAISLWAMDASVKHNNDKDNAVLNYLEEVNAKMVVSLYVNTGEEYYAEIESIGKYWADYTIAFTDFELSEGFFGQITPLAAENIVAVKIGLQYYYYTENGTPYPVYTSNNFVYIDNLRFTFAEETGATEITHKLMPSEENPNVCVIADFDSDTEETLAFNCKNGYAYEKISLSEETASGEGLSLSMQYQGKQNSVAYSLNTVVDKSVSADCIRLLLKGDGKATVYLNIFMTYAGTRYKYRATLSNVSDEWKVYTIGFDTSNFEKIEGTGNNVITRSRVQFIDEITFGIVNSVNTELSEIYLDKMVFEDTGLGYGVFTIENYEGQL